MIVKLIQIHNFFKNSISMKQAIVLSVLLHGFVLLLIPLFINKHALSSFPEKFITVDFVTMQSNSPSKQSKNTNNNLKEINPSTKKYINEPLSTSQKSNISNSTAKQFHTDKIFEQKANRIRLNDLLPGSLKFPRIIPIRPAKLLPPVQAMSHKQQKFLLKKANEIIEKLHKQTSVDSLFVWQDNNQNYQVKIRHKRAHTLTDLDNVIFEITTQKNGQTLSTELYIRRMAFSNYAQFVDYWDPHVAIHNDEYFGRFHSNTSFNISRKQGIAPTFYGKVTTASYQIKTDHRLFTFDDADVFNGGLERGIKEIRLPKPLFQFSKETEIDSNQIHFLFEESWIVFQKDGSYLCRAKSEYEKVVKRKVTEKYPFFIVGKKKANLHLRGTVCGKIIVYAAANIIIEDDIFYAFQPDKFNRSNDYLGLISEKDVVIAPPSVTGLGDLNICAAIFAKRKFCVSHFYEKTKATLQIYGSLSAGTITATEPRYATRIIFDKRLENNRPPNFPLTDRYEIVEWDRQWKVKGVG